MTTAGTTLASPVRPTARILGTRRQVGLAIFYVGAGALSIIFLFPFFWALSSSLKTVSEINSYPAVFIPAVPQWGNYAKVLQTEPFALWVENSLIIVVTSTVGALLSASVVGYSFARFRYRGRDTLFIITIGTLMLPAQVTLIPQFVLFHDLGWVDTVLPLIVPAWFGGGGFSIFLMRQFFMSLPRDLDEAAIADGANPAQVFWSILLPLCKPALSALAILWFIGGWNDFLAPVIYLNTPDKFTVAVGLSVFQNTAVTGGELLEHLLMAASVMAILPCVVIFLAAQRYFVQGIVLTGIKG